MIRLPLTRSGVSVGALGVVLYPIGWWFGWIELVVLAWGCLLALLLAIPFVTGRQTLTVSRTVTPNRVEVGEPSVDIVAIENETRTPTSRRAITETIGQASHRLDIDVIAPGGSLERMIQLPTTRRGRILVGPSVISKSDPLGLLKRSVVQVDPSELWVHPKVVHLHPVPVGFAKDLEGPTSDTSPAGDVSFHALREYSPGDDPRHVHWLSTAKVGSLMVKHYVDNRRPQVGVLIDDRNGSYPGDEFELAVSAAASLGIAGLLGDQPTSVHLGERPLTRSCEPVSSESLLDALSLVESVGDGDLASMAFRLLTGEPGTSVLVVMTGPLDAQDLLPLVRRLGGRVRLVIVRACPDANIESAAITGARVIDIHDPEQFALRWNHEVGR